MQLEYGSFTDSRNGHIYKTVKIGSQVWMVENLDVDIFLNGESIPEIKDHNEWEKAGREEKSAWCFYKNDPENGDIYGRLYNWYTVVDSRGLAPEGWRVATEDDWKALEMSIGMKQSEANAMLWCGTNLGNKLKETGTNHWGSPNLGATNERGFTALPGGYRGDNGGRFYHKGDAAHFWSSMDHNTGSAWYQRLHSNSAGFRRLHNHKSYGFSVRCIKNSLIDSGSIEAFMEGLTEE